MRKGSLPHKIAHHLRTSGKTLFRRKDLARLHQDYDQIGRALRRLEANFQVERVGQGLWRTLSGQQPKLDINRTWSKPHGVTDDVLIATTLAEPSISDLARLHHAYGALRLQTVLAQKIAADDIHPETAELCQSILDNVAKGAVHAYTTHHKLKD